LLWLVFLSLYAQPPQAVISYDRLDNQAVLKMLQDGIPEEAIIAEIRSVRGHFDISDAALEELKQAGASTEVIQAIREAAASPPAPLSPPVNPQPNASRAPASTPPPASQAPKSPPEPVSAAPRRSAPSEPSPAEPPAATPPAAAPPVAPRTPASVAAPLPQAESETDETPRTEVFGGFSIRRSDTGVTLSGWNAAFAANITRSFGLVADISRHSQDRTVIGPVRVPSNLYALLFGPQFSFRAGRIHGFGRGLVGSSQAPLRNRSRDLWHLTYGFGGGIDVGLSASFAIRPVQWDLIIVDMERQNRTDHRLSFGGVVRF